MSNPTYDAIVEKIDAVNEDIDKLVKRLAKYDDCPPTTPRSRRRKARYEKQLANKSERLDYLNEQLLDFSPETPDETQDTNASSVLDRPSDWRKLWPQCFHY